MIGLNSLWYQNFPKSDFHFFNENSEWLQVDKVGHAMTGYYIGKLGMDAMKWSGVSQKKSMWYGGSLGFIFLSTVEVFDGFSSQWGASFGDIAANALGTSLLFAQESFWKEQRILLKFSFSKTHDPKYRENIFGKNFQEQMLKDYNGQTYWLSGNIASFLNEQTKFPKWLNVAFGYGADGMLGGNENPVADKNGNTFPAFERKRQIYFSLDVDLTRIKTRSKFLNTFFNAFGFIKFPAPTLELTEKKMIFHSVYF